MESDRSDGEDEDADTISVSREIQVSQHRGDRCRADDARVQEIERAKNARNRAKSQVDFEEQLLLQLAREPVRIVILLGVVDGLRFV